MGWEFADWTHQAQDRGQRRLLVKKVPYNSENFMIFKDTAPWS